MRMNNIPKEQRLAALNALCRENRIRARQNQQKMISFEIIVEEQSPEDAVHEIIKAEGKNGIWTRDIRSKSKLPMTTLNKALKTLENRRIIKTVKTITNKKLYILFDLEPDESVTGGACYDSSVHSDVLKNVKDACFQYVFNKYDNAFKAMLGADEEGEDDGDNNQEEDQIYAAAQEILTDFAKRGLFKEVKVNELEHILDILVYESKLSKIKIGARNQYRFNSYHRPKTDLFHSPCLVCHLYNDCLPGSVNISPENCDYISVEKF